MDNSGLYGNAAQVEPKGLPSLKNTQLLELVTPKKHGTPFSFNILKMLPGGEVAEQSHPDQHAVFIVEGRCGVLLGQDWVTLDAGGYAHIPKDMTHSFRADEKTGASVLILKI